MAITDYIPAEDNAFRTWAENFASNISANFATYMLTAAQAASIQSVVDSFVDKLAISSNEATRTKQSVADKDDARSICENLCRAYAILIKDNTGISDGDKLIIGVRPINPTREPVDCPQTSPLLNIVGATPGSQTLRFADSLTPDSKAKPFGATALQLFVAIAEEENAPLSDAKFHSLVTRTPLAVEFAEGDNGKFATYYARWSSARGEVGPWSLPVSMAIAA
jgi:hypothetical protein